jgi:hypothetical protein
MRDHCCEPFAIEATMRPDPALPTDLRDLGYGEHLIVWGFRALVSGRGDCPVVAREFRQACGDLAGETRAALTVFVQQLAVQGRRPVTLAPPGCLTLTRDEQLVAAVFAAAQAQDQARLDAHLTWLLAGPPGQPFAAAARAVAQALALNGHALRLCPIAAPPAPEEAFTFERAHA